MFAIGGGVDVLVDGEARGTTPIEPLALDAGPHRVELATPCDRAIMPEFVIEAEKDTVVDPEIARDLGLASIVARVSDLTGAPLEVDVRIDEKLVGRAAFGETVVLPACPARISLRHEGLGAFIEHVELIEGKTVTRGVVLAPGPDMVRIQGGAFLFGMTEVQRRRFEDPATVEERYGDAFDEPWRFHQTAVNVATFEIDSTEVTVGQYVACRKAAKIGRCFTQEECASAGGCPRSLWGSLDDSGRSANIDWSECTVQWDSRGATNSIAKPIEPYSANRPITCVTRREAEDFCRWVGKRLPTEIEWEYAARSRSSDFEQPWGAGTDASCSRISCKPTSTRGLSDSDVQWPSQVCSHALGNTLDGLCDMMGNVGEYVDRVRMRDRPDRGIVYTVKGSAYYGVENWPWEYEDGAVADPNPRIGFRCARDVPVSSPAGQGVLSQ